MIKRLLLVKSKSLEVRFEDAVTNEAGNKIIGIWNSFFPFLTLITKSLKS